MSVILSFPATRSVAMEEMTHRRAHDLITEGFGPGFNGPLLMVIDHAGLPEAGVTAALGDIGSAVGDDPNVGFVLPGASNPAGNTTLLQAVPLTGPADAATKDLLERMRGEILPAVESEHGIEVDVAGPTALDIDLTKQLTDRLPWVMVVVIGLILVPSTMVMFNRANWWLPAWLDRILPNVDIEGEQLLDELESAD